MSWLTPTVRLVRWWSVLVPVAVAVVLSATIRLIGLSVPATMGLFIAAALAAAVPATLDDRAHELLGAMPTSRRRRVAQRLIIVVPAVAAGWVVAVLAMFGSEGDVRPATLGALVALGIAIACIAARTHPDSAATIGAAAPLAAVAPQWLPSAADRHVSIVQGWPQHSWLTIVAAAAIAIVATRDPARSGSARGIRGWRSPTP